MKNKFITFIESITNNTNTHLMSTIKTGYNICFENYNTILDDDQKSNTVSYMGDHVKWYGTPGQMIVINKNYVDGMWGNAYDNDKMDTLIDQIHYSSEIYDHEDANGYIELGCSYATGNIINFTDIQEEQLAEFNDVFNRDYDGKSKPASIGNYMLDEYIGNDETRFIDYKFDIAQGHNTPEEIYIKVKSDDDFDSDEFKEFVELELELKTAIDNNSGNLGEFRIQLRDGHHRVFGAIESGEDYICVNLAKEDISMIDGYNYVSLVSN